MSTNRDALRMSDALSELREAVDAANRDAPQRCGHSSDPMCCPLENFPMLAKWFTATAFDQAARTFELDMAEAWGGDASWLTTGRRVAYLAAGVLSEMAEAERTEADA